MISPVNGQNLAFPISECRERVNKVQISLVDKKLLGAILFKPENMYELTGFQTIEAELDSALSTVNVSAT